MAGTDMAPSAARETHLPPLCDRAYRRNRNVSATELRRLRNDPSTAARGGGLVAEHRRHVVTDPVPQRGRAADARIRDKILLVEAARVEADRAHEQLAARGRVLLEQPLERRAALARDAGGAARQRQTHRVLRQ